MHYIPLLLISIFVNFYIGSAIARHHGELRTNSSMLLKYISARTLLTLGIIFNISLLAYFKYTDFFLQNFNGVFGSDIPLPHIILPLGISFFTFTQIAFLVDSFKGFVKEYDIARYLLFVTYFPHLLAGPILHHREMMPQFASTWNFAVRWKNMAMGICLFSIGLFKKIMIADNLAVWANAGFDTASSLGLFEAWATSISYTLQLYFDFSGYTDMAIGMSLMFNIRLPINFNSPYKAVSIQDFWRRWHITLSRFLRDYIYIPLGGNKTSKLRIYFNLFIVFFIGGLWHGASWMFVIWGALHGIAMVVHRVWQNLGLVMNKYLAWFLTFNFVNIAWIFFRAKDMDSAFKVLGGMFGLGGVVLPSFLEAKLTAFVVPYGITFGPWLDRAGMSGAKDLAMLFGIFIFTLYYKNSMEWVARTRFNGWVAMYIGVLLAAGLLGVNKVSEFIYFNF
ncbi:MAG: MBOAT family protein [Campylobacterales bacterium]